MAKGTLRKGTRSPGIRVRVARWGGVKKQTRRTTVEGHEVASSAASRGYIVKSEESGKVGAHKKEALKPF